MISHGPRELASKPVENTNQIRPMTLEERASALVDSLHIAHNRFNQFSGTSYPEGGSTDPALVRVGAENSVIDAQKLISELIAKIDDLYLRTGMI